MSNPSLINSLLILSNSKTIIIIVNQKDYKQRTKNLKYKDISYYEFTE